MFGARGIRTGEAKVAEEQRVLEAILGAATQEVAGVDVDVHKALAVEIGEGTQGLHSYGGDSRPRCATTGCVKGLGQSVSQKLQRDPSKPSVISIGIFR